MRAWLLAWTADPVAWLVLLLTIALGWYLSWLSVSIARLWASIHELRRMLRTMPGRPPGRPGRHPSRPPGRMPNAAPASINGTELRS